MIIHNKYERVALQDPTEFAKFIVLLKNEGIKSYLEIGCKHGGSLWRIANEALPKGARVVAVDLPHGDGSFKDSKPHLEACVKRLRKSMGFDAHLFLGDSTNKDIVAKVTALGPFDACLIDANHTERYVRSDWTNYGSLARIVAFHDISHVVQPKPPKMPIQVFKLWGELKDNYRHTEIKHTEGCNGFGVLWRC